MSNENDYYELILPFIEGDLSAEEEAEFKAELDSNPELREELGKFYFLRSDLLLSHAPAPPEGMVEEILKTSRHSEMFRTSNPFKRIAISAACILLLLFGTALLINSDNTNDGFESAKKEIPSMLIPENRDQSKLEEDFAAPSVEDEEELVEMEELEGLKKLEKGTDGYSKRRNRSEKKEQLGGITPEDSLEGEAEADDDSPVENCVTDADKSPSKKDSEGTVNGIAGKPNAPKSSALPGKAPASTRRRGGGKEESPVAPDKVDESQDAKPSARSKGSGGSTAKPGQSGTDPAQPGSTRMPASTSSGIDKSKAKEQDKEKADGALQDLSKTTEKEGKTVVEVLGGSLKFTAKKESRIVIPHFGTLSLPASASVLIEVKDPSSDKIVDSAVLETKDKAKKIVVSVRILSGNCTFTSLDGRIEEWLKSTVHLLKGKELVRD